MKIQLAKTIPIGQHNNSETRFEFIGKRVFGSLFVWASSQGKGLRIQSCRC
jgi:hypothetical protein